MNQCIQFLVCFSLSFFVHLIRGQDVYANVLAKQLDQYCDLHNRCPARSDRPNMAPRTGKAGPRGPRGPPGKPGKMNYTVVKEEVRKEVAEIGLEEGLNEVLRRLTSLEETVSKLSRKDCIGLNKNDAITQNETGGVFEIPAMYGNVFCDLMTGGGGWMVFQRRMDGSVNFERNWTEYVAGFGKPDREFWLGLDKLHKITSQTNHELRVDLEDWNGNNYYATYTTFSVGDASTSYTLAVGGYTGTAGDSMTYHNGHRFYTTDQDNSHSCARKYGPWWHNNCFYANLNGIYKQQWKYTASLPHGVEWWHVPRSHRYSFKFVEMKIRPQHY